ncbi:sodium:solute symporter family protein [Thalassotalea marina]|uniref:Sodium:solute symporter n=1 Tax=Thalassotalea marina TaxID=1673741 RepID=A0A919BNN4_9GAMM|nr:sodium:solute symporter family protein [Thalassotalea marina]GHG01920.1 sodium:solute symporter [Thalassotalea marina]
MNLHLIDILIIIGYLLGTIAIGFYLSKKASKSINAYFLGGKKISWWVLGVSNASGMFDIAGTMWLVSMCFVYGMKSAWLPWVWPIFNQVFLMVYLSAWLRRSNVMTGAEWLRTRFGDGRGTELCHIAVVFFAVVSAIGFISYAFIGIGKFAVVFFPWDLSPNTYALLIFFFTTLYVVKGGMYSVVFTELLQFVIMTIAAISVGIISMNMVSAEALDAVTPDGWNELFFGWQLELDWTGVIDSVNQKIYQDGFGLFGFFFMMMVFKGVLSSLAGPVPNYDMQRILATKSPKDAAKMSAIVSLVMFFPRYMMVAGLSVLALVYMGPKIQTNNAIFDFEQILPFAISELMPVGLAGLLIAGLLAAFMSTYAAAVNAAPAYIVNDIYKKHINPNADNRTYIQMSYLVTTLLVVVGIGVGLLISSINDIMQWIFGALFGGYAAANILKWHWWRFNAYGYFYGLVAGLLAALLLPLLFPELQPLYAFPFLFLAGLIGSISGTLLTPAEKDEVLIAFYQQVRPWGWWSPIRKKVKQRNPTFVQKSHFQRDVSNVVVGIVWQLTLVVIPIYLVIREFHAMSIAISLLAFTSFILKKNWYDKLEN